MSKIERVEFRPLSPVDPSPEPDWAAIAALARVVRIDAASGAVTITNGASRLTLLADGTIRLDGTRIVTSADQHISLNAPRIDLN